MWKIDVLKWPQTIIKHNHKCSYCEFSMKDNRA